MIPNQLLAALVEAGQGAAATHYASTLTDPADLSSAIAAIVNAYTTTPDGREITLWAVPLGGLGESSANAAWKFTNTFGGADGGTLGAAGALQTANQFGPLIFDLGNHGTISLSVTPSDTNPTGTQPIFNAGDIASWTVGQPGLIGSTGNTGWTVNNTFGGGNGGIADVAGILETANQFGPAVFNLNVVKALNFTQPLNGTVLENGQLDDIHAVDIGQWVAGIPGLFSNTGTTGFIADWGYGNGLGTGYWTGGLQTTTQIGPFSFTFTFFPTISFNGPSAATPPAGDSPLSNLSIGFGTGVPDVSAQINSVKSALVQPNTALSAGSARTTPDTADKSDPAPNHSPAAAAIAPTVASLGSTTTLPSSATTEPSPAATGQKLADSSTQINRQKLAEAINPVGAITVNPPTSPGGTSGTATAGASPSANNPNGSVGTHPADDEYVGKHRLDSNASSNESSSGSDGSTSAG